MVTVIVLLFMFGVFLAYANGANDNFKGVATLFGSKTASYSKALTWASLTTFTGSALALFFASKLIVLFKGQGLVLEEIIALKQFPVAVGLATATTVMLATRFGLPVSTTHALIGALLGAGLFANPAGVNGTNLASKFFAPLIIGPVASIGLTIVLYGLLTHLRQVMGIKLDTCLCVGNKVVATDALTFPRLMAEIGDETYCRESYSGQFLGASVGQTVDGLHYLSAGLVCFARGLNDTPKIAAILMVGQHFSLQISIIAVTCAMVIGGLLHSKKIADTLGNKLTSMNPGQALSANLVTSLLVLCASKYGLPVSTTHVSCGAIMGIGTVTKQARWGMIGQILLAWVTTLPMGTLLGLGAMGLFTLLASHGIL
ncbi:MAG: hypothetical protein A2X86_18715 [Bdellovibrionales bacterium GWA2_49_15]|nr:MAG: hypothetical protein A2X86_18715 [Bdellovibrionales bacterium GWA2_49_15]HAZ14259.1 inorganic phosphate transporter [Bdellovibrionales bacterium]